MKSILFTLLFSACCLPIMSQTIGTGNIVIGFGPGDANSCTTGIYTNSGTFDSNQSWDTATANQYFWWPFTNTPSCTVCGIDLGLIRTGSTNFNLNVGIYTTTDFTNPVAQVNGDSVAVPFNNLSTTLNTNRFSWTANNPVLSAGTVYVVVLKVDNVGNASFEPSMEMVNPANTLGVSHLGSPALVPGIQFTRRPYFILYRQ